MPFLIAKVICASLSAHGFCVFGSSFVYQMKVTHNRLSFVTVVIELLHGHGLGRGLLFIYHDCASGFKVGTVKRNVEHIRCSHFEILGFDSA